MKALKNLIAQHNEAIMLDMIQNSDSFAKSCADKYNAKVIENADKVYRALLSRGESEELASRREREYIKRNSKDYTFFK